MGGQLDKMRKPQSGRKLEQEASLYHATRTVATRLTAWEKTARISCYRHRVKVKVMFSRYRPGVAQRVSRGIVLLFHYRGTRRGWVVSSTPRPYFIPGKDAVPIVQEAGWSPGRSGRAENLVPTEIRSWTVQPAVSRSTDWATRSTTGTRSYRIFNNPLDALVLFSRVLYK